MSAEATTEGMTSLSIREEDQAGGGSAAAAAKGTAKRDALRANERAVQKMWEDERAYEADPDGDGEGKKESFLVTFPYPYSNGHLHIGHAFSLTKAVFRAQFERHQGKNVLFPFAFHCTGMPIQAVRSLRFRYACFDFFSTDGSILRDDCSGRIILPFLETHMVFMFKSRPF